MCQEYNIPNCRSIWFISKNDHDYNPWAHSETTAWALISEVNAKISVYYIIECGIGGLLWNRKKVGSVITDRQQFKSVGEAEQSLQAKRYRKGIFAKPSTPYHIDIESPDTYRWLKQE